MDAVHPERPVVVGVDGSEAALAAVDWAVGEATARQCRLRVVHAFIWPLFPHVSLGPSPYGPPEGGLRAVAEGIVDEAVRRAATGAPGLRVESELVTGAAGPVMITEAGSAQLLVVGSRGFGGFTGLLVGSVSNHLAAHAACPVVVIRPAHAVRTGVTGTPPTCVVGIDDPAAEDDVLGFAHAEASRLHVGLTVIHCVAAHPAHHGRPDHTDSVAVMRQRLDTAVRAWQPKYPDVRSETTVVSGPPGRTLTEMSRQALLVVVGSHGSGGFRGMLIGSVSQQVLHHAAAPVAIVRGIGSTAAMR